MSEAAAATIIIGLGLYATLLLLLGVAIAWSAFCVIADLIAIVRDRHKRTGRRIGD